MRTWPPDIHDSMPLNTSGGIPSASSHMNSIYGACLPENAASRFAGVPLVGIVTPQRKYFGSSLWVSRISLILKLLKSVLRDFSIRLPSSPHRMLRRLLSGGAAQV